MVTQETYLFHDTIRTNILYARLDATQSELEQACEAANILPLSASSLMVTIPSSESVDTVSAVGKNSASHWHA
jgi:ABC-type multidrug transport system fused ATPase/permease subunit